MMNQLVRYIGAQRPELNGCEGRVHSIGRDAFGYTVYSVAWCGRYGVMVKTHAYPIPSHDVKVIKKHAKGILPA
jgi:hypothetical protein